jgi:hypothetical protein
MLESRSGKGFPHPNRLKDSAAVAICRDSREQG